MSNPNLLGERLRACRVASGETLENIGALVGMNKSTVMRWESGETGRINTPTLYSLAEHYGVTAKWLSGETDEYERREDWLESNGIRMGELMDVPILGSVRGGSGGIVEEEVIGKEAVQRHAYKDPEPLFWLKVSGDSMSPAINEGDLVLVRKQSSVDSGSYAVVIVGGEEGLVKKVVYGPDWISLQSVNPYYPPRRFENEDVLNVQVVGLVLESRRKFT